MSEVTLFEAVVPLAYLLCQLYWSAWWSCCPCCCLRTASAPSGTLLPCSASQTYPAPPPGRAVEQSFQQDQCNNLNQIYLIWHTNSSTTLAGSMRPTKKSVLPQNSTKHLTKSTHEPNTWTQEHSNNTWFEEAVQLTTLRFLNHPQNFYLFPGNAESALILYILIFKN